MNKFEEVLHLAKKLGIDYNEAFDIVYASETLYDESETDDAI